MAERGGPSLAEITGNKQLVPNYASFYGESLMPPSDEGKRLTPQEFQEQFPVRYDVWNTLSQGMLGHSETGVSLNNPDTIQRLKTRLHVLNKLDRYITAHHANENGRTLRERQMTVFEDIRDHLEQGEAQGYIKLPTGSGKTVIFTEIAEATDLKTLIVVPRQLLVDQTVERFQQFAPGLEVGKIYKDKKERGRQVEVTTYESMLSSIDSGEMNPEDYNLVVLDEVHKGLTVRRKDAIEKFTNAIKLGFTATPNYSEAKQVSTLLGKEIHAMTVREAVEEGMLSPFSVYLVKTNTDISNVKITASGDYDPAQLQEAINNKERNLAAVQMYQELMKDEANQGKLSIAYCAGIQHARDLAAEFQEIGVTAGVVYGGQNKREREQILEDYRNGKIQVLCNAKLLIEGFDEPQTGIVLNVAPTASLVDAEQRGGRGLRRDPNDPNKHAIIVDIVDQTSSRRFRPITFAQVVDGAYVLPRWSSSSSNGRSYISNAPDINIEGIEVITSPEEIMRIVSESKNDVDSLHKDGNKVKEEEIILAAKSLERTFFIGLKKARQMLSEEIKQFIDNHPEYVTNRQVGTANLPVVTAEGREEFVKLMQDKGVLLRDNLPKKLQEGEIGVSPDSVRVIFEGHHERVLPIVKKIVDDMQKENSIWVERRQSGNGFVTAITIEGKEEFMRRMQEQGIKLRDESSKPRVEELTHDDDIVISQKSLRQIFFGDDEPRLDAARKIVEEFKIEHPDYIAERKNGRIVITGIGRDDFMRRMKEEGIRLKGEQKHAELEHVKDDDLLVSLRGLGIFTGKEKDKQKVAKDIIEIMVQQNPQYTSTRLNTNGLPIQVITAEGREEFISQMNEAGYRLKNL